MADKNVIVVSADPKGHFGEAYAIAGSGTFVPGQFMEIDQTAALKNGRPQYKKWTTAGAEYVVVRENDLLGMNVGDGTANGSYAAGSLFLYYIPIPGDIIQALCTDTEIGLGSPCAIQTGGSITESTGAPSEFVAMKALATVANAVAVAGRLALVRVAGGVSATPETTTTDPP